MGKIAVLVVVVLIVVAFALHYSKRAPATKPGPSASTSSRAR